MLCQDCFDGGGKNVRDLVQSEVIDRPNIAAIDISDSMKARLARCGLRLDILEPAPRFLAIGYIGLAKFKCERFFFRLNLKSGHYSIKYDGRD